MIDIHSHILPAVDDGAQTREESLDMLKLAAASGTTDIIATPHANTLYVYDERRIQNAFSLLSGSLKISIRLHLGCELHLNYANLQNVLRRPENYTLNRSKYLLLELPNLFSVEAATRAIEELIRAGLVPVIAHAERNIVLQRQPGTVLRWKDLGCLIQITGQSVLGSFGTSAKRGAQELMRKRLVDFVASDAHDCVKRSADLRLAYDHVSSTYGDYVAERLFVQNPTAVLSNSALQRNTPQAHVSLQLFRSGLGLRRSIKNAG